MQRGRTEPGVAGSQRAAALASERSHVDAGSSRRTTSSHKSCLSASAFPSISQSQLSSGHVKSCILPGGPRRGKMGVKGAKNFHLLMKGKITHLALAGPRSRGRDGSPGLSLDVSAPWVQTEMLFTSAGRPPPLWMCRPGRGGRPPPGAMCGFRGRANVLGGSQHLRESFVVCSQECTGSSVRMRRRGRGRGRVPDRGACGKGKP